MSKLQKSIAQAAWNARTARYKSGKRAWRKLYKDFEEYWKSAETGIAPKKNNYHRAWLKYGGEGR